MSNYSIAYFSKLLELGTYVNEECDCKDIYACAATNGQKAGILLTHYNNNDSTEGKLLEITVASAWQGSFARVYKLDGECDMTVVQELKLDSGDIKLCLDMPLFTSYYVEIEQA